ncbi:MAG: hypothetical protein CL878_03465 [Dehalococcoidia bacterium]|nr:hypothetical protein [Dehalococcoidia bacterium]
MPDTPLEFKPDWPDARRRHEAWWRHEVVDRVALQVTAPRNDAAQQTVPEPRDLAQRWTDPEYAIAAAEARMAATYYGGEAFPIYVPNLGPDVFAAYLGSPLEYGEDTTWSVPIVRDWRTHPPLCLDPENRWWQLTLEMTRLAVERSQGRYLVGLTDVHSGIDALAALRDPTALCFDLYDCPDAVQAAVQAIIPVWFQIYEDPRRLIWAADPDHGTSTWLPVWSPGRCYPVSCDFAALISPVMFRQFILPHLRAEVEWLDHAIFHLDGPDAIRHLDILFELPEIRAIQWVPGTGSGSSMLRWLPLLRRIQAAGRGLHLSVSATEVLPLLRELSPEGLMLSTNCRTEEEARALLRATYGETHDSRASK